MKKRIVSFLMALVMAVSLLPVSAFAADGELPFSLTDDKDKAITGDYLGFFDNYLHLYRFSGTADSIIKIKGDSIAAISDQYYKYTFYEGIEQNGNEVSGFVYDDETDTYTLPLNIFQAEGADLAWLKKRYEVDLDLTGTYTYYLTVIDDNDGSQYYLSFAEKGNVVEVDKSELQKLLAIETDGKYHTTDDRWNGNVTSENGFWTDYQTVLSKAKTINDDVGAMQTQVDDVVPALQAAIGNLIPTSRVNATALYETLNTKWCWYGEDHMLSTAGDPVSADNCTTLSWPPYAKALKDAQALLDTLYENGAPTDDNTASKQGEVDRLAAAVDAHKLVNKEAYAAAYDKYMAAKPEAEALLQQYDPAKLTESDYTADSWTAYTNAYAVLKTDMAYRIVGGTTEDWKMLQGFNGYFAYDDAGQWTHYTAHIEALKNAYRQLTSATDVTVSFTYINNFSALYPSFGGTSLYANSSLPLAAGSANLLGAYNAANIELDTHDDTSLPGYYYSNTGDTNPQFLVFINGSCAGLYIWSARNSTLYPQRALSAVQLHNGDSVKMVRVAMPQFNKEDSSGLDSSKWNLLNASEEHYQSSVALIDMSAPGELQVGDKAKLSATVTGANTTNLGQSKSAAGITLFISDPSETKALSQPIHKTAATTDADGSLQYVFTKPGWYTVAMFNVTPDELTFTDVYQSTTIGEYYSLYGGDYALIHVTEADDTDALLKKYRAEKAAEAKAYFDNFHDYDFTAEGYAALKAQYETLTANLQKATDLTALMDTYDADFAQLKELGAAAIDHAAVIAGLRQNLSYLPDDLNDLNANYKQLVKDIQTVYGGLNSYQKKLLSANETKRLDAVAKINADSLKAPAKVTLEVDVDENQLPKKNDNGNPYFGWPNIKWVVTPNVDGTLPAPKWAYPSFGTAKAGDHAFIRYYLDTTDEKYWPVWSVDGGNTWNLMETQTLVTPDDVKTAYDGYYLAEYVIPGDVVDGSTITFKVKMISKTEYQAMTADSEETVAAARTAALSRLQTLYNSLGDKAKAAYDTGVDSINAAASVTAVETAYQSAVVAMKEAADNYGKVQVIVENTTYSKKNGAPWDGTLVDTWVDLSADSTMMSCVAAALKTKKATVVGAESNYISSINGLGEFDGNKSAGWMGTLNDWFTNEGFGAFTVKNGKLTSGDVIRIMFTSSGYGADLGGTWGNSDTTVKALTVDGAMLTPNFIPGEAGGQYDYTLIIDGESASVKLTPTASNKNFQVKTFLNEKVTDRSEGSSFYKRTETIPVKVGDTIYVGCGAKNWLSMNNQAGNKQNSDGTWYALHVVSINTGATYVTDLIAKLPTSLKYETYTRSMNDVAAARAAYEVLAKDEQGKVNLAKLVNLEKQIEGFTAVDAFKVQLAALPEAEKLSVNDREAVDAAEAAYKVLKQKDCLTVAEKEKAETVFAKMAEIKGNVVLAVEQQIDAIGEVTLENEAAVKAAQAAYDALTDEQKQLVNSEKVAALNAAVAKLAELKREKLLAEMGDIYASVGESLQAQVNKSAPIVGSIGGEWLALGLARSGRSVPAGYYDNVVQYVKANVNANERLHNSKSTDNSRVILALTAIGKDPTNVGGHNLLKGLDSMSYINKQGINGPVFALIALDSHNYPTFGEVTRDVLIDRILSEQVKADGGWALGGADEEASDVDVTAMTIQALAPYYKTNAKVKTAVDKGLTWLSAHQQEDGGFASWGAVNSESCAQVIVALAALGIDPLTDSRFIKNGITALDALCGYYTQDDTLGKGFAHVKQSSGGYVGGAYNQMATEQAYYALNAYYRFAKSQNRLYDMTDVCIPHNFGAWTVTKAATCTESGISTRKCSVCGTEETMIVPSLGHSMTATAGKAATCTEAGHSAYWSCSRCGKFFSDAAGKTEIAKDSWVIAALGHDEATRAAVAATCYASGHEADTYCKRCGIVLAAGATIPATGKHTYVNGVCTVCGVKNPMANVKTDDIKVDSKNDTLVKDSSGLVIKAEVTVDDEKLIEIKAAVENGSITVTVDNENAVQTTDEQKKADGGKSALESKANDVNTSAEVKKELSKLIDKLADMRKDNSGKKNAQIEKVVDVAVELVKTVNNQVTSVAQLIELPQSVTVTISITDEMYNSLLNRKVCVVRSHTDANGNVTTTELPAYLGGTEGNRVLSFQTDKASTFAIVSYETVSTGGGSGSGSITVVKPTSANTADDSQMVIWLGSAVMAAAAVVVLTRKQKRVSK